MEVINWITAHWQDILATLGGLVAVASIVVKFTATDKDDAVLAKVVKVLDYFSVVNPKGTAVVKADDLLKPEDKKA